MKRKVKAMLSLLLVFALLVTTVPAPVFATEPGEGGTLCLDGGNGDSGDDGGDFDSGDFDFGDFDFGDFECECDFDCDFVCFFDGDFDFDFGGGGFGFGPGAELRDAKEGEVVYNLGSYEITVGSDEEQAEKTPWNYKLFDEDGKYTIILEDNAFFPYEVQFKAGDIVEVKWFDTPGSTVEFGGFTFGVYTEQNDPTQLQSIGVWIDGKYIAAYPEPKEFSNPLFMPMSLLPLYQASVNLNLGDYDIFQLRKVEVEAILSGVAEADSDAEYIVWKRWSWDEEEVSTKDDVIDMSRWATSTSSFTFNMVVGSALQLDTNNKRFRVTVTHGRDFIFENKTVHKTVGTTRTEITDVYPSGWLSTNMEHHDLWLNKNHNDAGKFHIAFDLADNISENYEVTIYSGDYSSLTSLENAIKNNLTTNVTEQLLGQKMNEPGSGFEINKVNDWRVSYSFTALIEKGDEKYTYRISGNIDIEQPPGSYVSVYGLYANANASETVASWYDWDWSWANNTEIITYQMKFGNPADATYYFRLMYIHEDNWDPVANQDFIKKSVEGHFNTYAAAAAKDDITEQLFLNESGRGGFAANYSGKGKDFTIFTTDGSIYKYTIKVIDFVANIDTRPNADSTFVVTGAKELSSNEVYRMLYQHESYVAFGYQTIFTTKADEDLLKSIKPIFTTAEGVNVYAGHEGSKAGDPVISGEKEGAEALDFSNGPVQYSATATDGENHRNYWVSFVQKTTAGPDLYLIYEECDGECEWECNKDDKFREVYLNRTFGYRHDIFLANIGDAPFTELNVTLSDAQNVKLDEYWKIGGINNDTLAAFTTTQRDSQGFFELPSVAKVRLVPDGDGEVKGKLTITANELDDPIIINLKGSAGDPKLITDDVPDAVKFVPYGVQFLSNNKYPWNTVKMSIIAGKLPDGMELKANGELYGVPRGLPGEYKFTIRMENSDPDFGTATKEYTLVLLDNDKPEVVEAQTSPGYRLEERVPDIMPAPADVVIISEGPFGDFIALWLNGVELVKDTDYEAEKGSTVITIFAQTFSTKAVTGKNTIAGEFRVGGDVNGELKRFAQNFNLTSGGVVPKPSPSPSPSPAPGNGGGGGGGGGGGTAPTPSTTPTKNYGDGAGSAAAWNELVNNVTQNVGGIKSASGGSDFVVQSGKKVVIPTKFLNTLQGTNNTVMFNTGAGVTFSISGGNIPAGFNNKINLSLSDKMKAPASAVSAVKAGTITSIEIPMESRENFGMAIGTHFNVGAANAGNFANLFRYNETTGQFEYLGSFEINDKGQAMFGITGGADYVLTVTTSAPNLPIVSTFSYNTYTVQSGDTLGRIAARHGMTLRQLLNLNPAISNPNRIRVGQIIRVI